MFSMSKNYIVFDSMMVPPQKNIFLLLYCIIFDNKFLLILRNSKLLSINFLCVTLSHMSIVSRVVGVKRIEEEVTYGGGTFKRRKVFLFMIQYLCPIFAGIILLSSVANAFGWISM